jgi:hypothetical protein
MPEEKSAAVLLLLGMNLSKTSSEKELTKISKVATETGQWSAF